MSKDWRTGEPQTEQEKLRTENYKLRSLLSDVREHLLPDRISSYNKEKDLKARIDATLGPPGWYETELKALLREARGKLSHGAVILGAANCEYDSQSMKSTVARIDAALGAGKEGGE